MEQLMREETVKRQRRAEARQLVDREMNECLARLRVWQTECLLAPHGMDRFAVRPEESK